MNEQDLLDRWKDYDAKLSAAVSLNRENTIEITRLKVASRLSSMKPIKWMAVALGIAWCAFLSGIFMLSLLHTPSHLPFIFFMTGLLAINVTGVGMYIYHLVLIDRIENSDAIIPVQRELAKLKASTLTVTRVLILQIPFYASLHIFLATDAGTLYWVINGLIVVGFLGLTIWLFFKINEKNKNERWFRFLFGDREWSGVIRSIEMLDQIEDFESASGNANGR